LIRFGKEIIPEEDEKEIEGWIEGQKQKAKENKTTENRSD
jgi:hypothetical protein